MSFKVKEAMTSQVVTVTAECSIDDVTELLLRHNVSGLPVVDQDQRLQGIITERDLLDLLYNPGTDKSQVSEYLTADPITVTEDDSLTEVAELFLQYPVRRLPVVHDGRLVGVISRRDVVRFIRNVRQRVHNEMKARCKVVPLDA